MVSSTFTVLIVLPLLLLTQSASTHAQAADMGEVLAAGDYGGGRRLLEIPGRSTLQFQKEANGVGDYEKFLGRKVMFKRFMGAVNEDVNLNGGGLSSSASSVHIAVRNSINVKVQPTSLRNTSRGRPHTHRRVKVKISGNFIPLNADYHVPRPHPPKNN